MINLPFDEYDEELYLRVMNPNCPDGKLKGPKPKRLPRGDIMICDFCQQEMNSIQDTCTKNLIVDFPDGTSLPSMNYPIDEINPCHDCYVKPGGKHHPGCDQEKCPKCQEQIISCGCLDSEYIIDK